MIRFWTIFLDVSSNILAKRLDRNFVYQFYIQPFLSSHYLEKLIKFQEVILQLLCKITWARLVGWYYVKAHVTHIIYAHNIAIKRY